MAYEGFGATIKPWLFFPRPNKNDPTRIKWHYTFEVAYMESDNEDSMWFATATCIKGFDRRQDVVLEAMDHKKGFRALLGFISCSAVEEAKAWFEKNASM